MCEGYVDNLVGARDEGKGLDRITHISTQGAFHSDKDFGVHYRSNHALENDKTLYFYGGYNDHEVKETAKERTIDTQRIEQRERKIPTRKGKLV
ncbi:hypothetical protein [Pasteuria penetrans]|uniref:hypothetical protein n=1 Tax=Pasteuria penetrans TaxID=86005 RepID=UPI000F9D7362|nr:hypothetical protein [Pasteuria penetrans]